MTYDPIFQGMREIDVGRGTENGEAKFAAVFGLSTKNHRGALCPPPHRGAGYGVPGVEWSPYKSHENWHTGE